MNAPGFGNPYPGNPGHAPNMQQAANQNAAFQPNAGAGGAANAAAGFYQGQGIGGSNVGVGGAIPPFPGWARDPTQQQHAHNAPFGQMAGAGYGTAGGGFGVGGGNAPNNPTAVTAAPNQGWVGQNNGGVPPQQGGGYAGNGMGAAAQPGAQAMAGGAAYAGGTAGVPNNWQHMLRRGRYDQSRANADPVELCVFHGTGGVDSIPADPRRGGDTRGVFSCGQRA